MTRRRALLGVALAVAACAAALVLQRVGAFETSSPTGRSASTTEGADRMVGPTLEGVQDERARGREGRESEEGTKDERGAASTTLGIRVRVRHGELPVADARVALRWGKAVARLSEVLRTDKAGEAVLVPARPLPLGPVDPKEEGLQVEVLAEGFQPELENVEGGPVLVELEPGVAFDGRVEDARMGAAVVGANVVLDHWFKRFDLGTTDASGRFHVPGAQAEDYNTLLVSAQGFARGVQDFTIQDGKLSADVVIRLEPGTTLRGIVRSADGAPVKDAEVLVVPSANAPPGSDSEVPELRQLEDDDEDIDWRHGWYVRRVGRRARTDAEGGFLFEGLSMDALYVVHAEAKGHADAPLLEDVRLTSAAPEHDVTLTLRRPTHVFVRVRVPDGRTLSDEARVRVLQRGVPRAPEGRGDDGAYRIAVAPGPGLVFVHAEGFRTVAQRVVVAEGTTENVEIVLDSGLSVEGIVVDEAGRAVSDAQVRVGPRKGNEDRDAFWLSGSREVRSGADGRFVVAGLTGEDLLLTAWSRGEERVLGVLAPLDVTAPARDVKVVVHAFGGVRVRLVLPSGAPFVGSVHGLMRTGRTARGGPSEVGEDGVLRERGLRRGEHAWELRPVGHAWFRRTFKVADARDVDLGDVVLDAGVTLIGRVVDEAGRPVAGVDVNSERGTITDGDGRFVLEHCPRTSIHLYASKSGYVEVSAKVDLSQTQVVALRMERAVTVRGVIRRAHGPVSEDDFVALRRPDAVPRVETTTDDQGNERTYGEYEEEGWLAPESDGRFSSDAVGTGRWIGWWRDKETGKEIRVGEWDFAEGKVHEIEITLPK